MRLFGLIGTAAAFLNYQKAKKEYEQAQLESDDEAILAAIRQYDNSKYDKLKEYNKKLYDANEAYDGILPIPVLNVGMMVGNYCRMQPKIALQNTGDEAVKIYSLAVLFQLKTEQDQEPQPIVSAESYNFNPSIELKPGEIVTVTVEMQKTSSGSDLFTLIKNTLMDVYPMTPTLKEIKQLMVVNTPTVLGTKAITILDVPAPTNLLGYVTANVAIMYNTESNKDVRRALFEDVKGTFCYKGEAFYPGSKWEITRNE